jgi:endonuclease YncB( thermonuclease family)
VPHANNDGDSFHVRCGADAFVLRLYFVDTPETNLQYPERTREQAEHFGATLDDTMKAGAQARVFVRDALKGPFTVVTRKAAAAGRGKEPRYYGMVHVGGKNLDEVLVLQGLARAKGVAASVPGEKSRAHSERLQLLEDEAKHKGRGLWARKK